MASTAKWLEGRMAALEKAKGGKVKEVKFDKDAKAKRLQSGLGHGKPGGVVTRVIKWSHESIEEATYSKYGLTLGKIIAGLKMERCCRGIIATGWPTWAFAAKDKG